MLALKCSGAPGSAQSCLINLMLYWEFVNMVLAQSHALLALHVKFSTGSLMFMISTCYVYMYSSCTPLISCFALLLAHMHHTPALHCSPYPSNNTNIVPRLSFLPCMTAPTDLCWCWWGVP